MNGGEYTYTYDDQRVVLDSEGTPRFCKNRIVRFLLQQGGFKISTLMDMPWDAKEIEHFYQLIGYSVGGFGELNLISDEAKERADKAAEELET